MKIIKGDLIELAKLGKFDVIVHGCNCFNTMGNGIAKLIRKEFPEAYKKDLETIKGDMNKLGTYTKAKVGNLIIINAYTQYKYGYNGKDLFEYEKFQVILNKLKKRYSDKRIGFPLIGCGLAGGNKKRVIKIIKEVLNDEATIVIYKDKNDNNS